MIVLGYWNGFLIMIVLIKKNIIYFDLMGSVCKNLYEIP